VETGITFYNSPIGTIQIKSNGEYIEELTFLNLDKGEKIHENEINFEPDPVPVLKKCVQQLDEYFKGSRKVFDLPLTQAGTDFQKKVWNELLPIPYGKTTSYLLLSKSLGNIKAIRAVGAANGKNKICIIVPCHRVIGSNGDMVGYGGEVWRKKWLLEHEARINKE
jgi:methylated-DNA-[protein]-cysteine S-methyltransferase